MIDKLYDDISKRLSEKVEELRWIELEYGQLEIPEDNYPVQFPCGLIDFPSMEFQDETRGNQQAVSLVQIRLGLDFYEDLMIIDGAGVPDKATALLRMGLISKIHLALQGWELPYFTPMTRVSLQTERRDDGIKVFVLLYAFAFKDDSAAKVVQQYTGAGLELKKFL